MSGNPESGVAAWLTSHVDVVLPSDRLPGYAQATAAAASGVGKAAKALAMEDEPAGFILALARRAEAQ